MIALTSPAEVPESVPRDDVRRRCDSALDEYALESLLAEFGGLVKGTLLQRYATAFGAADVDDVMAIAVERVWRKRSQFDPGKGSLKAWFFRIADNTARDVLRYGWFKARKLEVALEQSAIDSLTSDAAGCAHDDSANAAVPSRDEREDPARAALLQMLADLPEAQRRILWADALSSSGPVATADLARELQLSRGTVRVYRAKALARLRAQLRAHPLFQPSSNDDDHRSN